MKKQMDTWVGLVKGCVAGTLMILALGAGAGVSARAAASTTFDEVIRLLKENLPGVSDEEIQKAALQGLLSQFPGRVQWVGQTNLLSDPTSSGLKSQILDGRFGYLRLTGIVPGTTEEVVPLLSSWNSNRVQGGILDLRGCRSRDFAAAAGLAEVWLTTGKAIFDAGDGLKTSKGKEGLPSVPWVILVNQETAGAAEALAGALRQGETGIMVGRAATAGQAATMKDFVLKDGQRLRISAQPVKTGDGKILPPTGLVPDILVMVEANEERAHLELGIKPVPRLAGGDGGKVGNSTTNKPSRRRLNEADLVRMQKEGKKPELDLDSGTGEAVTDELGTLQDPVLNRGFDLLKALVVVRKTAGK